MTISRGTNAIKMIRYQQIFENNRRWAAEREASEAGYFEKLSVDQYPEYLYIGCSDSRVPAEIFMGAKPGEVFVHRNVANLVDSTDLNAMSVIHFAVEQLRVKHIVICGHYRCGGVKAAMEEGADGPIDSWLDRVRNIADEHHQELAHLNDDDARFRKLVELNVKAQCLNVLRLDVVQESIRKNRMPSIHGWVFDVQTGRLTDLHFEK